MVLYKSEIWISEIYKNYIFWKLEFLIYIKTSAEKKDEPTSIWTPPQWSTVVVGRFFFSFCLLWSFFSPFLSETHPHSLHSFSIMGWGRVYSIFFKKKLKREGKGFKGRLILYFCQKFWNRMDDKYVGCIFRSPIKAEYQPNGVCVAWSVTTNN